MFLIQAKNKKLQVHHENFWKVIFRANFWNLGLETKKSSGSNSPAVQQPTDKRRKVASVFREDDDDGKFYSWLLQIYKISEKKPKNKI